MTDVADLRAAYALIRNQLDDEALRLLLAQLEMRHLLAEDRQTSLADTLLRRALDAKDIHARH